MERDGLPVIRWKSKPFHGFDAMIAQRYALFDRDLLVNPLKLAPSEFLTNTVSPGSKR